MDRRVLRFQGPVKVHQALLYSVKELPILSIEKFSTHNDIFRQVKLRHDGKLGVGTPKNRNTIDGYYTAEVLS